jgi:hypothetical protein
MPKHSGFFNFVQTDTAGTSSDATPAPIHTKRVLTGFPSEMMSVVGPKPTCRAHPVKDRL